MQSDRNRLLLALALTKGLGPIHVKNLISYCGSPEAVYQASPGQLKKAPGIGGKVVQLIQTDPPLAQADQELAYCDRYGINMLTYLDEAYPTALKYIHDAPLVLFKQGQVDLNAQPGIAIVGTRKATDYGKHLTEVFTEAFVKHGLNIVSGLAYGIDITAHRTALKLGGLTTGVLGHGLDTLYPGAHAQKAREMRLRGGLLSEYPTGTKPDAPHFPARNRIISGICKATIVIEAAESGGALITAKYAFEQNREVYAVPGRIGDPYSAGCNRLIRDQVAKLITSPEEVLEDLAIQWQQHDDQTEQLALLFEPPNVPLSAEESKVLNLLSQGEALIDVIAYKTGIGAAQLTPLLLAMEFKELVRQMPGKKYRRIM